MQLVKRYAEGNADLKRRPKWIANAFIGLSRIERRDSRFEQAIEAADEALKVVGNDQKKITRRASGTRARALAATAIDSLVLEDLEQAKKAIDECLEDLRKDDVRNRLTLDLWKALVLNALDEGPEAERALKDYEKNATGVDVGRIQEFAEQVTARVRHRGSGVGLPIESGDLRWRLNQKALKRELMQRVAAVASKTGRARELGITRAYYLKLEKELEEEKE
jgi:tetratricopeptide (TPR) repeat protein